MLVIAIALLCAAFFMIGWAVASIQAEELIDELTKEASW